MPKWLFGSSIKTQLTVLLFVLTATSILVIGYLGIHGILESGSEAETIATNSIQQRAEQFLRQTTLATAAKNSLIFTGLQGETRKVAEYVKGLFDNPNDFPNNYWKYNNNVHRLPAGSYGNSATEPSSIYMQRSVVVTPALKRGLELTAYMDFYVPSILKNDSNIVAVYYNGTSGESRYYPNIDLASFVPPDFDVRTADFYTVVTPQNDPAKTTKSTSVYDDPAGNGLLITIAQPIYDNQNIFIGTIGLDVTLGKIAKNIEDYNPIGSSYAFLIDNTGKTIAMPDQAYLDILGRSHKKGEFGADLRGIKGDMGTVLADMRAGKEGFSKVSTGGNDLYIAYAPIAGTTFSLGITAKQSSLLAVADTLRNQVNNSTGNVLYFQILPIALILLGVFWFIGFIYIRILTQPLIELTAETRKITEGDFRPSNVHVNSSNEVGNLANVFNNMTSQLASSYQVLQRQVHELADGKAKDDAILNSIGDGVIVTDSEGKVLLINSVAGRLLGTTGPKIINEPLSKLKLFNSAGNELKPEERPWFMAVNTRKKVDAEVMTTSDKESSRILKISVSPVMQEGKAVGTVEILRDVTEEKEVDRLKTDFISIASHQLRTPLSAIRWFSEMLMAGDAGKLKPEQKEFVGNISQSTKRMIELVGSLLNISRLESGRVIVDPKPTNIKQLIEGVVEDLKTDITDRRQTIELDIDSKLPEVNIDPRLVGQVYMNLLTNAIKYTPNSGRVDVRVVLEGDEIVSEVKDSGYGIPRAEQIKIFDRFFRGSNIVKVETDGTGLGLYLIKVIIESSGGRVWFESEEGKGTTFWFTLPLKGMKPKTGDALLDA